ncbi:hypothetical protein MCOR28_011795, partial [Pyricularia oryzae]
GSQGRRARRRDGGVVVRGRQARGPRRLHHGAVWQAHALEAGHPAHQAGGAGGEAGQGPAGRGQPRADDTKGQPARADAQGHVEWGGWQGSGPVVGVL